METNKEKIHRLLDHYIDELAASFTIKDAGENDENFYEVISEQYGWDCATSDIQRNIMDCLVNAVYEKIQENGN